MSEAKHVPLPWFISRDTREGMEWNNHIACAADPNLEICSMFHDATPENELGEANAALIVRAVNNFDALVKALQECADELERISVKWDAVVYVIKRARSALLAAKAKP